METLVKKKIVLYFAISLSAFKILANADPKDIDFGILTKIEKAKSRLIFLLNEVFDTGKEWATEAFCTQFDEYRAMVDPFLKSLDNEPNESNESKNTLSESYEFIEKSHAKVDKDVCENIKKLGAFLNIIRD